MLFSTQISCLNVEYTSYLLFCLKYVTYMLNKEVLVPYTKKYLILKNWNKYLRTGAQVLESLAFKGTEVHAWWILIMFVIIKRI